MEQLLIIEVIEGFEVKAEVPVALGDEVLVGRSSKCKIPLDAKEISRQHVCLIPGEKRFQVQDMSRNGVFHNGSRVENGGYVPRGDTLTVGPFTLVLDRKRTHAEEDRAALRGRILAELVEHMDLSAVDKNEESLRPRVEAALSRIAVSHGIPAGDLKMTVKELADEALGLGPLESLLADDRVSEIMVVDHESIFCEREGRLEKTGFGFSSNNAVRTVIERIVTPLGRRIDESSPMVDARLKDGSRVNAVIPPLAIRGACITIRKFPKTTLTMEDLVTFGSLSTEMVNVLTQAVVNRANVVISGGTGSGKTTLLNVLSRAIPENERIVTVEDAAELSLSQDHVVSLESRPPNAEGRGQVTIRDLVRNALRMRPDRIVVGECRGGEALDMLQAMNTGHDGSLTTTHANSPAESISRLETLCLMAGLDLPVRAIRDQIAGAVDLIVQQCRFADGARRITSIAEVSGIEEDGTVRISEIFRFVPSASGTDGTYLATGFMPTCVPSAFDGGLECQAS